MSDGSMNPELDPELEEWLADARDEERREAPAALDGMLEDVEKKLEAADGSWLFWLRSRPTWIRRAMGFAAASLVVLFGGALTLRPDFAELPLAWIATGIVSLAILLGLSVHSALRPLHQPPMPPWMRFGVIGVSVAATCALAMLGPAEAAGDESVFAHVSPCLFYGLLFGLPVYLVLRLLDRGRSTLALVAACAGGLTGNLVLQLHCPRGDSEHLMAAHFAVVLLFLGGLGLIHWVVDRVRSR